MDQDKLFLTQYNQVWEQRRQHLRLIWLMPAVGVIIPTLLIDNVDLQPLSILTKCALFFLVIGYVVGLSLLLLRHNFFIRVYGSMLESMDRTRKPLRPLPQFGDRLRSKYRPKLTRWYERLGSSNRVNGMNCWFLVFACATLGILLYVMDVWNVPTFILNIFWRQALIPDLTHFPDLMMIFLRFVFWLSILVVACMSLRHYWSQRQRLNSVLFLLVLLGLIWPTIAATHDFFFSQVSSGKIGLHKKRNSDTIQFIPEVNQYRFTFPDVGRIDDVEVFFTSYYNASGQHIARTNWVKYIDFRFEKNYIQSNHILNDALGEHTIVFKYRTSLFNYPRRAREAEQSLK